MSTINIFRVLILSSLLAGFGACGSSGGDSDFGGAANVDIDASPRSLDTGDRTIVEVRLRDVHEDGIKLKVRFPTELQYVEGSGQLELDDEEEESDLTPGFNAIVEGDQYLVFYLRKRDFGEDDGGTVIFELVGIDSTERATVEVDPDVDSTTPIDPANPEFASEADVDVEVVR